MDVPDGRWLSLWRKSLTENSQESYDPYWINHRSNIPQNSSYSVNYLLSLKPFKSEKQDMQDTAGEVKASSLATFPGGLLHTDEKVLVSG